MEPDVGGEVESEIAGTDLGLGGKLTYPVADILEARGIPFVFVTLWIGRPRSGLPRHPVLEKPFHRKDLGAIMTSLLSAHRL